MTLPRVIRDKFMRLNIPDVENFNRISSIVLRRDKEQKTKRKMISKKIAQAILLHMLDRLNNSKGMSSTRKGVPPWPPLVPKVKCTVKFFYFVLITLTMCPVTFTK